MLQLVRNSCTRTSAYLGDRPFWHKRWVQTSAASAKVGFINLPVDHLALPKSLDPNWRRNWKLVLLKRPASIASTRAIIIVDGSVSTTLMRFDTEYFTMRIGPEVTKVALEDFHQNWYQPEFYEYKPGEILTLSAERMGMHNACLGLQVTGI